MNHFLRSVTSLIARHSVNVSYASINVGVYDVETSTVVNTTTTHSLAVYPKHIVANQYNFPTMIGKDIVLFYLSANALIFVPKVNDLITYNTKVYKVISEQSTTAQHQIVMYKLTAVRS